MKEEQNPEAYFKDFLDIESQTTLDQIPKNSSKDLIIKILKIGAFVFGGLALGATIGIIGGFLLPFQKSNHSNLPPDVSQPANIITPTDQSICLINLFVFLSRIQHLRHIVKQRLKLIKNVKLQEIVF